MVHSKLDPNINYPEIKTIDSNDINYDAPIYEANVLGIATIICIGQPNYTFSNNQIVYYPIYLIKDDKVLSQIGIYEVYEDNIPTLLDNDDDLDITKVSPPLLYSFTNEKLIKTAIRPSKIVEKKEIIESSKKPVIIESSDTESEEETKMEEESESEEESSVSSQLIEKTQKLKGISIPLQTLEQAVGEIKSYKENKNQPWIQTYYQNNYFNISKVPGDGDCFYNTVKLALESVGINTSVIELRKQVSDKVSQSQFEIYLERFNLFNDSIKIDKDKIKKLVADNESIRDKFKQALSREEKIALKAQSEENIKLHSELKAQLESTKKFLVDVEFMRGIKNIQQLKDIMNTSLYYADEFAISTLEQVLNIKIIVISHDQYEEDNKKTFEKSNIITCGLMHNLPSSNEKKGIMQTSVSEENIIDFNPDYYILAELGGVHYNLITYRDAKIFTFAEIPYYVKLQIVNRCLERMNGAYQSIPQFRKFNEELGIQKGGSITNKDIDEEIVDIVGMDSLYNPKTKFIFHDGSTSREFPGEAMGETIASDGRISERSKYIPLASIKEWRKQLSNGWNAPFMLDGHRWLSVEHYYNANKFKKYNPDFYLLFTMDGHKKSNYYDESTPISRISEDIELAKIAGSKTGKDKYNGKLIQLRPDTIHIDADFFNGRHSKVMEDGMYAKFSQNPTLSDTLLLTRNAKLVHYNKGKSPTTYKELMRVRSKINSQEK